MYRGWINLNGNTDWAVNLLADGYCQEVRIDSVDWLHCEVWKSCWSLQDVTQFLKTGKCVWLGYMKLHFLKYLQSQATSFC